jgi:hypothetical protein
MKITVFAIDVGAPHKGNLGWANADGRTGGDLDKCINEVNKVLPAGPVALGFEAPLYVPVRDDPNSRHCQRKISLTDGVLILASVDEKSLPIFQDVT